MISSLGTAEPRIAFNKTVVLRYRFQLEAKHLARPWKESMPPTLANGKICYIETPAVDVARSADFYRRAFGWNIRKRGDGSTSFDDAVGDVSGTWVFGWPPALLATSHRKSDGSGRRPRAGWFDEGC